MGRPKIEKPGRAVSVYLSGERLEKALLIAESPKDALLNLLDSFQLKACREHRLNGCDFQIDCEKCLLANKG